MKVDVLLGLQWGDEGKGKVVDVLTPRYDVVARFQGGPNAGHTLEFEGQKYVLLKRGIMSIRIRVSRLHLTIAEILITTTLKNSSTELTCHR